MRRRRARAGKSKGFLPTPELARELMSTSYPLDLELDFPPRLVRLGKILRAMLYLSLLYGLGQGVVFYRETGDSVRLFLSGFGLLLMPMMHTERFRRMLAKSRGKLTRRLLLMLRVVFLLSAVNLLRGFMKEIDGLKVIRFVFSLTELYVLFDREFIAYFVQPKVVEDDEE